MTINAIYNNDNNYPNSIKSYLVDKVRQSVFNSPMVKIAFVASTVLVTGIAAAYLVKKTKEAVRVAIDRPLQTACLTAAIFATGTVIVYHPVMSMITFVGISYILLNRNLYTKIHDTHQIFLNFFDTPFKVIANLTLTPNNSKNDVSSNDNQSLLGITKAIEQLNLEDLKLGSPESLEDQIISNDTLLPLAITEEVQQLNPEDATLEGPESLEDEIISNDTLLPLAITEEVQQLNLEDTKLESPESPEDLKSSNEDPSPLGIAKTIKQFNFEDLKLINPKPLEGNVNSNNNPSPLGIAKAVGEFNFEDLKLGSRDPLESATWSAKPFTFPTPIKNIYPNSNPLGVWTNKPLKVIKTVKNPTLNGGLLPKSYGNLLKLVRIIPK